MSTCSKIIHTPERKPPTGWHFSLRDYGPTETPTSPGQPLSTGGQAPGQGSMFSLSLPTYT